MRTTLGFTCMSLIPMTLLIASCAQPTSQSIGSQASPGCTPVAEAYPAEAKRLRQEGTTRVLVHADSIGTLERVEIYSSSGSPSLDSKAIEMISKCRFKPARNKDGEPMTGSVIIDLVWKLEQ